MLMLPAVDWGAALVAPPPSSPTIDQSFCRTCKRPVMVSPLARTERIQTPDWQESIKPSTVVPIAPF
ncbi:hypothetical protein A3839_28630 [Achromobacter insolitus]|nr:hypothetical protein A3839_28630 [Achromobacter insolitus]